MNKKILIVLPMVVLVLGLVIVPVQAAGNVTPLKAKCTLTGANLILFDSKSGGNSYAFQGPQFL